MKSDKIQTKIQQRINEAWTLRFNQRNEEALLRLIEIKQELGLPSGEITSDSLREALAKSDSALLAQAALLQSSLFRFQGSMDRSLRLNQAVKELLAAGGASQARFRLEFELATNASVLGDYGTAMESYLRAAPLADSPELRLACLVNVVMSMDAQGLEGRVVREEIRSLAGSLPESELTNGIRAHLQGLDLRIRFRHGQIANVFHSRSESAAGGSRQIEYFRAWLSELPFHSFSQPSGDHTEQFLARCTTSAQRGFRARTLQGRAHPDDRTAPIPDQIDRFYLWVWRWLAGPDGFSVDKALNMASDARIFENIARLTVEDRQLLRNALLWLSVFDPSNDSVVSEALSQLSVPEHQAAPLLSFEKLLIHWVIARRNHELKLADDYLLELRSHSCFENQELHFGAMIEILSGNTRDVASADLLKPLIDHLLEILPAASSSGSSAESASKQKDGLIVDLYRSQILNVRGERLVVSEPMALAFGLLARAPSVSYQEFVSHCFGIKRFDSTIHMSKIFNLLSRMRQLTKQRITFHTKNGFVRSYGDWSIAEIRHGKIASRTIGNNACWQGLLSDATGADNRKAGQPARNHRVVEAPKELLSRARLEALINRPRSTVNRYLAEWEKKNLVERINKGKATLYRLNPKITADPRFSEVIS
ncbi:MAG: hypothetical protein A2X94_11660 [Bdellovibrionales bacterium GWB1_55_8]|nr:MAG: hypothetical protein A2X94_11660 [Bdellovibrionales bacterium GWB1_55_8]